MTLRFVLQSGIGKSGQEGVGGVALLMTPPLRRWESSAWLPRCQAQEAQRLDERCAWREISI